MAAILNFKVKMTLKKKINARNGFPMQKLVINDLLFVKIVSQIKISLLPGTEGGHFEKRHFSGFSPKIERDIGAHFKKHHLKYIKSPRNRGLMKAVTESREMTQLLHKFG